jgi:predicted Zn-dependent protease
VLALPESPRCSERIDAIHAARGDAAARAAEWRAIAEKHPEAVNPWQRLADALDRAGDRDGASEARERAVSNAGKTGA